MTKINAHELAGHKEGVPVPKGPCNLCGSARAQEWTYDKDGNREHPICVDCADSVRDRLDMEEAEVRA